MNAALVAAFVFGVGARLWPEAPTEAAALVALAVLLAAGEIASGACGRGRV